MTTIREVSKAKTLNIYKKIYRDICIGLSVKELAIKYSLSQKGIYMAVHKYLLHLKKEK